jgi:ribosomal protein L37E
MSAHPDPREQQVVCPRCGEEVYFVPGLRDQERWRHTRTQSPSCDPRCRECGQTAKHRIGGERVGGSGVGFVTVYFLCDACLHNGGQLFIERT